MFPQPPENDATLEALARRLRHLPPPPVPAGLKGRLLSAIPPRKRRRVGRFWFGAAALVGAAAAVLFTVRLPSGVAPPAVRVAVAPAPRPAPTVWTYEQALRQPGADASGVLDQVPPFDWPVAGPRTVFLSDRNAGAPDQ